MDEDNNNNNNDNNSKNDDNSMDNKPTEEIDKIVPVKISKEMKESYLAYSMSVIIGRALPDARDGLKPVHRRVLYAMHDMGLSSKKPFKKSARIVGEVLGKYHPHGDSAVYQTMVRMAQPFSMNHLLVSGQGNFGSVDGDNAAAMRYTEARMTALAEELLRDIEKETVNFVPNFDESLEEPSVLPAKSPNLLINGSTGIAVGMATNIPPHNLGEVCEGIIKVIDNPEIELSDLMNIIKAPDFPTGGLICGRDGVAAAYRSGKGKVIVRSKVDVVERDTNRLSIIVNELPYTVNKSNLIKAIADLIKDKKIEGISDLRDESDRDGMRVVIELTKGTNPEIVLNQLYKHTQMQISIGITNLAIVDNEPKVLPIKGLIKEYIKHRDIIVTKRTEFDLKKAEARAHILEGLRIALDNIDEVIKIIKGSKDKVTAHDKLMERFKLSDLQIDAILQMRLQQLTGLEREKIDEEYNALIKLIAELRAILADHDRILGIIKDELRELKDKYGVDRKSEIVGAVEDVTDEDLIDEEIVAVTVTGDGYIKRIPISEYKEQHRGGSGVIGMETKEEDNVEDIFTASTHDYMLFFSNMGQIRWKKVFQIPESGRYSKGRSIVNLVDLKEGEYISAMKPARNLDSEHFVIMATKNGTIKKTSAANFSKPRNGGIRAITISEDDELIKVEITDGNNNILLASRNGKAIHFREKDVRPTGRTSQGVRGIRLAEDDKVIGMEIIKDVNEDTVLTVTEKGYGKRTAISDYRLINRGGKGVINIVTSDRNGKVIGIKIVSSDDNILLTNHSGKVIRMPTKEIKVQGRNTQGVRLMRIKEDDKVAAISKVKEMDETVGEDGQSIDNGDQTKVDDDQGADDNPTKEDDKESEEKGSVLE